MNEVVKYHNELNKISLRGFGQIDYDIFMLICARMRDQGANEKEFSYSEIRRMMSRQNISNAELYRALNKISESLAQTMGTIQHSEYHRTLFVFFTEFDNNGTEGTLKVCVNEKYQYMLNALTANFTRFELEEFISLESKYAKTLYRLLKQFRTTGDLTISVADFRERLDIPKSYTNKVINVRVIKPAVDALRKVIPDLQFEAKKASTHGNPVYAYRFSFSPEAPDRQRTLFDSDRQQSEGRQTRSGQKKNAFNSIEQHDYDFNEIEAAILDE